MGRDQIWQNSAALLIVSAIIALALFLSLRPLHVEAPASGAAQALLRLDNALGATVEPVDSATAKMLGLSSSTGRLVVTSVANTGPAANAGLRVGDIIERIGGRPAEVTDAAETAAGRPTRVLINRRGKHAMVSVDLAGGARA